MKNNSLPTCIGFIMDGNRRWAKEQGLSTFKGHKKGGDVLMESMQWVRDAGIPHAVYYAFSTENWNRSEEEVAYLMELFREWLNKIEKRLQKNNEKTRDEEKIRVRVVGRRGDFAKDIQDKMIELEAESLKYPEAKTTIWFALSYGGRAEIVSAVNQAIKDGKEMTEESFGQLLWTEEMPDPDMIVRTGGEKRLSNFMTWKSVYSELYFIDKYWPALTKSDFEDILKEYEKRERRRGA